MQRNKGNSRWFNGLDHLTTYFTLRLCASSWRWRQPFDYSLWLLRPEVHVLCYFYICTYISMLWKIICAHVLGLSWGWWTARTFYAQTRRKYKWIIEIRELE